MARWDWAISSGVINLNGREQRDQYTSGTTVHLTLHKVLEVGIHAPSKEAAQDAPFELPDLRTASGTPACTINHILRMTTNSISKPAEYNANLSTP